MAEFQKGGMKEEFRFWGLLQLYETKSPHAP
jgi:hypothetical protein